MKSVTVWFRRLVFGFLGFLILLFICTSIYARIKDWWILTHLPEGSVLVDIGERRLHVRGMGLEHDGPAIVLLPGYLSNSSNWSLVQPALAKTNRVYAFDPAGFAWSEPASAPLTPSRIADDLNAVLTQLDEKEIILVGFSGGALYVYNYYHRYPQDPQIVGLVWAEGDALIPEELTWYNGDFPIPLPDPLQPVIVELGIWRLLADRLVAQEIERIPETERHLIDGDYLEKVLATGGTRQTAYAVFDMVAAFPEDVQYTANMPMPADIPVFVLQADYAPDIAVSGNKQEIEEIYQLQRKRADWFQIFVENTPGGRYIEVANSSHLIVWEQPQVVIETIRDMVELVSE